MQTSAAGSRSPVFSIVRAGERYFGDHGWLKTCHSFSFADYHDPKNVHWGALRVVNDDTVAPGEGFPAHPHRDMEILTYVLSGELEHRDSMGNHGVVGPGGVQYMSAGTGVRHSEYNHSANEALHFLQMWVIPSVQGEPPRYGQQNFAPEERANRWLSVASGRPSVAAPIALRADASFHAARLDGAAAPYAFAPGRLGFLFVADGEVTVNGERLARGDAVRTANVDRLDVRGRGELVLWDVPPLDD